MTKPTGGDPEAMFNAVPVTDFDKLVYQQFADDPQKATAELSISEWAIVMATLRGGTIYAAPSRQGIPKQAHDRLYEQVFQQVTAAWTDPAGWMLGK